MRAVWSDERQVTTKRVIQALRQGYGVEDMHVMGICHVEFARHVVQELRASGILRQAIKPEGAI